MGFKSLNESFRSPDESAVSELKMFVENDGDLYRGQTTSILKNLATKKARGIYNPTLAEKLFMYLAESGAKKYVGEYGGIWHTTFPIDVRRTAARDWRVEFATEYALGNYDDLLPKKYRKKPR